MQHKQVKSSNIESVAYDAATKTLEVKFRGSEAMHRYAGVPQETYDRLMAADSVGKTFHRSVKGKFEHRKL